MEKIPCIKCTPELWEYIKPRLEEWGYKPYATFGNWEEYPLLVINVTGELGIYNNVNESCLNGYDRELTNNVEDFLEKAARLKGFTYKRKDVMKIKGIEIEPGMVITTIVGEDTCKWIVFPTESDFGLLCYEKCSWYDIDGFLKTFENNIECIRKKPKGVALTDNDIIWSKKTKVSKEEIADKLNIPVGDLWVEGFPLNEKASFPIDKLLPGMVVKVACDNKTSIAMVTYGPNSLCVSGPEAWFPVEKIAENLVCGKTIITDVYSRAAFNSRAYELSTQIRTKVWSRRYLSRNDVARLFNVSPEVLEIIWKKS